MKFLFIEPKNKNFIKIFGKVYISKLTLPYIASYVPDEDDVVIVDENIQKLDFNSDADCVFITALTVSAPRAYEIGDEFIKRGKTVIMGGIHVSMLPREAIQHADAVVIGECESVIQVLIEDLKNKRLKNFYQSGENVSLDDYKNVNRKLISKDKYRFRSVLETGRGCPFNCDFCSTTKFFGSKQRFRPVQDVVDEIKTSGYKWFFFTDDNIVCNKKRAKELFEALIPLNIHWTGQGSINIAQDEQMLKLMKKSGCNQLLVGFETLDPENINAFTGKKNINVIRDYETYIKAFHDNSIGLLGCFIFGFDNDEISLFDRTYKFIMRNNIDAVQLSILTPFPGTKLYAKLDSEKRIIHKDWSKYDVAHVTIKPKLMTTAELRKGYNRICKKIYSFPNIAKRCFRSYKYLKNFSHSFITFPLINYVYRRLFSIGKTEKIWNYFNEDLRDTLLQKVLKLKKNILENKNSFISSYHKNVSLDMGINKLKKVYRKLIKKINGMEKNLLRENIEKVSKKIKRSLEYLNQKIEKFNKLNIPKSILSMIEENKKKFSELYAMIF